MSDQYDWDLAEVIAETREFLDTNGWASGEFKVVEEEFDTGKGEIVYGDVVGYCTVGGVLYSQGIEERNCCFDPKVLAVTTALCRVLEIEDTHQEKCTGINCRCTVNWITTWNDAQDTWEPIQDALILAEKDARSGNVDE